MEREERASQPGKVPLFGHLLFALIFVAGVVAIEQFDGVGFEFYGQGGDGVVHGLFIDCDLNGLVVGAGEMFALHEDVGAFDNAFCEFRKTISIGHDIVPLGAIFTLAGFFVGPGDFGSDGELSHLCAALKLSDFRVRADEAKNCLLVEVHDLVFSFLPGFSWATRSAVGPARKRPRVLCAGTQRISASCFLTSGFEIVCGGPAESKGATRRAPEKPRSQAKRRRSEKRQQDMDGTGNNWVCL